MKVSSQPPKHPEASTDDAPNPFAKTVALSMQEPHQANERSEAKKTFGKFHGYVEGLCQHTDEPHAQVTGLSLETNGPKILATHTFPAQEVMDTDDLVTLVSGLTEVYQLAKVVPHNFYPGWVRDCSHIEDTCAALAPYLYMYRPKDQSQTPTWPGHRDSLAMLRKMSEKEANDPLDPLPSQSG